MFAHNERLQDTVRVSERNPGRDPPDRGQEGEPDEGATGGKPATTQSDVGGKPAPRLPHERDESSDAGTPVDADVMQRAHDDAASDRAPTDKGEQTDELYARTLRDETPGSERDKG